MLLSLNLLKSQSAHRSVAGADQFKVRYLKTRLLHQKQYFYEQSLKAARKARRFRILSRICLAAAILFSVWIFGNGYLPKIIPKVPDAQWISRATSTLFQIATVAGALLVVHDCDRRQRRYQEIHRALAI
jgi:hypothetical protein